MPDESGWRSSRWRRAQAAAIATIGAPIVEAVGATWSWRETGTEHLDEVARLIGRLAVTIE